MRLALVTGGAGFIGSHIVDALLQEGWRVRVLDDFSTGRRANLAHVGKEIEILEGDVRDAAVCRRAVAGAEVVFHQAAIPSVPRSVADPVGTHAVNLTGTVQMLTEARQAGVRRFVFASSSAIYGNDPELPKRETMRPAPLSPYAAQKLAGEYYLRVFQELQGIETVALRYFNVFGPRQDPASEYAAVIPKFITRMLAGTPPTIFGDGRQTRDFIYVGEVARANLLAAAAPAAAGRVINIAGGRRLDLLDLAATINEVLGARLEPVFAPPQPGDVRDSVADISQARAVLGFEPRLSFADGLRATVAWYRQARAAGG
ncbi:MAG: UDP-glucose 4-epimerase [Candidatus Ozemobacter sibiricus]|uniref:UDP-glucose 4-epimerase n=1 Tax=Candidatus Ozemobacter sibiricus TaxID=2268124 RepID=A0A367ZRC7_9BACT|nr:MAG: UDP-glucose 4-epimerase [Candidatus Ozemobacter sibiricus]